MKIHDTWRNKKTDDRVPHAPISCTCGQLRCLACARSFDPINVCSFALFLPLTIKFGDCNFIILPFCRQNCVRWDGPQRWQTFSLPRHFLQHSLHSLHSPVDTKKSNLQLLADSQFEDSRQKASAREKFESASFRRFCGSTLCKRDSNKSERSVYDIVATINIETKVILLDLASDRIHRVCSSGYSSKPSISFHSKSP